MIGNLSDSHDNLEAIKDAVAFFNEKGFSAVLHAGDIVSSFTARAFKELKPKLYFVFENNEGDRLTIREWFGEFGAEACGDFAALEIEGLRIALLHGINEADVNALAVSGDFDGLYLVIP
ncbi:metallophosphoesterase family protein [Methanococcoides sp. FTZ1]|uniref:metallophosphoesterase family protein n=1 Tax=Methanococcoides sp. FTZ1 TaxID=3439061 RepID=UPI003F8360EB